MSTEASQALQMSGLDEALYDGLKIRVFGPPPGSTRYRLKATISGKAGVETFGHGVVEALDAASARYYAQTHRGATEPRHERETLGGESCLNVLVREGFELVASRRRGVIQVQILSEGRGMFARSETFWAAYDGLCLLLYRVYALGAD